MWGPPLSSRRRSVTPSCHPRLLSSLRHHTVQPYGISGCVWVGLVCFLPLTITASFDYGIFITITELWLRLNDCEFGYSLVLVISVINQKLN
ncbi:hypothetical protein HanIR_Chr17g0902491 [Helianthus annuus]|nr:hypothetical protein HanIR_Chr17g0902491 [Helianthus annuus]